MRKQKLNKKTVRKLATAKSANTIRAKAFGRKIDKMFEEMYGTAKKKDNGAKESVERSRIHYDGGGE